MSPSASPTAHACRDGSHQCDKGTGGICNEDGAGWVCACQPLWVCVSGCASHVAHECKMITASPSSSPSTTPTPRPFCHGADGCRCAPPPPHRNADRAANGGEGGAPSTPSAVSLPEYGSNPAVPHGKQ
eukprot:gene57320-biopygen54297